MCHVDFSYELRSRERAVDSAPVEVTERITLITLDQEIVSDEIDLHVGFELNTLHVSETSDVGEQEPSVSRGQEVVDQVTFAQATRRGHDRVHIVIRSTRTQFGLRETNCNWF